MTPPTIWQDDTGNIWQDDGGQYFTDDPPLSVLPASVSWHVVGEAQSQTSWSIIAELSSQSGWSILIESSVNASWTDLAEISASSAWEIEAAEGVNVWRDDGENLWADDGSNLWADGDGSLPVLSAGMGWAVLAEGEAQTGWSVIDEEQTETSYGILTEFGASTAWSVLTETPINAGWAILKEIGFLTVYKQFNGIGPSMSWSVLTEQSTESGWQILASGLLETPIDWEILAEQSAGTSWANLTESSTGTSWGILDEIETGCAWSVLDESAVTSTWGILTEDEQSTSWAIADEIDGTASWSILVEAQASAGWSILKELSISSSWEIQQDGLISAPMSWRVLAEDDAAFGWAIVDEQSVPISWAVDAINEISTGIGWAVLDETSAQAEWSIVSDQSLVASWAVLNEQSSGVEWAVLVAARGTAGWSIIRESSASIGWRISAAEVQAGIAWSIIRQRYLSTEWRVLAERPITLAWRDMAEITGGVSWRMAGTTPASETLGIDFASLLPPSIAYDPGIMAASGGSSAAFTDTRNLIPESVLYARIDELSSDALDHIAWGFHIDGWEFAETIERKRAFVKLFFDFHRYKGTAYGLRLYWRALINRLVLKIDPPGKSFLGVSMTQEERERFESVHPEVRVYPFRHSGVKGSFFCGDCTGDPRQGYGVYPARTEALLRIGDRVTVYDPQLGEETEINRFEYDSVYAAQKATDTIEIRKPGNESNGGIFLGRYLEGETVDTGADQRLYSLTLDREYATELERRTPLSIQPSLTPFRTTYEVETESGDAVGMFLRNRYPDDYPEKGGSCIGQHFPVASNASERIYRKLRLFDPDRVPGTMSTGRMTYLGAFRVGQQLPHTARVAVDMQGKRIPGAQFLSGYLRGRHLCASDTETRIEQMRYVGKMAKRASDKVLISIRNRYEITTSSGLLTGTKKCGQIELEVI